MKFAKKRKASSRFLDGPAPRRAPAVEADLPRIDAPVGPGGLERRRPRRPTPAPDRYRQRRDPGRLDRGDRPGDPRHDPPRVRLGLCVVLDDRPGAERAHVLARIGHGRRRVRAGHAVVAVQGGRGAERPDLAASRPRFRREPRRSERLLPSPRRPPRRDSLGRLPAAHARGPRDRHDGLLRQDGRRDVGEPARRAPDARPGRLRQDRAARSAGRAVPDHADDRERALEHDVLRPGPQGPVHQPGLDEDAQAARAIPADQGRRDDRQVDRHLSQEPRAPAEAPGRPARTCRTRP